MIEETTMGSNSDFEVLPVGSTDELIVMRKLIAQLLDQDAAGDDAAVKETIKQIRSYYRMVV